MAKGTVQKTLDDVSTFSLRPMGIPVAARELKPTWSASGPLDGETCTPGHVATVLSEALKRDNMESMIMLMGITEGFIEHMTPDRVDAKRIALAACLILDYMRETRAARIFTNNGSGTASIGVCAIAAILLKQTGATLKSWSHLTSTDIDSNSQILTKRIKNYLISNVPQFRDGVYDWQRLKDEGDILWLQRPIDIKPKDGTFKKSHSAGRKLKVWIREVLYGPGIRARINDLCGVLLGEGFDEMADELLEIYEQPDAHRYTVTHTRLTLLISRMRSAEVKYEGEAIEGPKSTKATLVELCRKLA